jgi:hypothetical protein
MIKQFVATACTAEQYNDFNSFVLVLADNAEDPQQWIELQIALAFDQDDIELGTDTYCIVDDSGALCYGGVEWCTLDEDIFVMSLFAEAAEEIGFERVELALQLSAEDYGKLEMALPRIFGDTDV